MKKYWVNNLNVSEVKRLVATTLISCSSLVLLWGLADSINSDRRPPERTDVSSVSVTTNKQVRNNTVASFNYPCIFLDVLCSEENFDTESDFVRSLRRRPVFSQVDELAGRKSIPNGWVFVKLSLFHDMYDTTNRLLQNDEYYTTNSESYMTLRVSQEWLLIPALEYTETGRYDLALNLANIFSTSVQAANENDYWLSRLGFDTTDFYSIYDVICESIDVDNNVCKVSILESLNDSYRKIDSKESTAIEFISRLSNGEVHLSKHYNRLPNKITSSILSKYLRANDRLSEGEYRRSYEILKTNLQESSKKDSGFEMMWKYSLGRSEIQLANTAKPSKCRRYLKDAKNHLKSAMRLDDINLLTSSISQKLSDIKSEGYCDRY
ncbi:hypothetical protein [Salinibacter ruber]|jgi:hypothetical protein|uniref:hypothetical protein n=2 Tax=Salinibacter ruber TaxID=146919 RepID=UPI0021679B16|nr:hypothetical protein [Salinibacter ruber]